MIVAVHDSRPRTHQTIANHRRAGRLAAIGAQDGNVAALGSGLLHIHRTRQRHIDARAGFRCLQHLEQDSATPLRVAESTRDPDIALTVNSKPAGADTDLESFHFARIGCGESGDPIGACVRDPDPVLLVDREVERRSQVARVLPRVPCTVLKQQFALGWITFGEMDHLTLLDVNGPNIAAGRDYDTLHQAKLAVEIVALWWRERFAVVVELRNRLAAVARYPNVVVSVDGHAKADALEAAAGVSRGPWRQRPAVGGELRNVAVPQRILILRADDEIVARPDVALAVNHQLAGRAQAAASELQRQDPGARRPSEVGHERNRPQVFALGDRVERVQQLKQPPGFIARVASDPLQC